MLALFTELWLSLTIGGILGGIVISRWIRKMDTYDFSHALTHYRIHLLSHFHPGSVFYIYATVIAEQFVTVLVLPCFHEYM
jgi:PAT family beta-lactamase induction signal transducer AmpG